MHAFSLFFFGWFVFTTLLLFCTLKSTIAFFFLFFTLDLTFLFVGLAYLYNTGEAPHTHLLRSGGGFGILAAFASWYNAFAGLADDTNSFFVIPAVYFPWTGRKSKPEVSKAWRRDFAHDWRTNHLDLIFYKFSCPDATDASLVYLHSFSFLITFSTSSTLTTKHYSRNL